MIIAFQTIVDGLGFIKEDSNLPRYILVATTMSGTGKTLLGLQFPWIVARDSCPSLNTSYVYEKVRNAILEGAFVNIDCYALDGKLSFSCFCWLEPLSVTE
jgi:hypothetical protein